MDSSTEIVKGLLEGCIFEIISREPTYGYAISQQLRELGFEELAEGTVYTILLRLERARSVDSEKKPSHVGPPRKFYTLTEKGEKERLFFWRKWQSISSKINYLKEKS